jgi:hypothetical protein
MKLWHTLVDEASGLDGVDRASSVAGALCELSVGLCRGNFLMCCACLGMLAVSSGTGLQAASMCPLTSMMGRRFRAPVCERVLACACDVRGDHVSIVADAWFCC